MANWLWFCACVHICAALAAAAEKEDASCLLQAQHALQSVPERVEQGELLENTAASLGGRPFCRKRGKGTRELNFLKFNHGAVIVKGSYKGMEILSGNAPRDCKGPLMILDTTKPSPDADLKKCGKCKLLVYSQDGDTKNVNDCGAKPSVTVVFEFAKVHDVAEVWLFDQEEESKLRGRGADFKPVGPEIKGPKGPGQDGKRASLANCVVRGRRRVKIRMCAQVPLSQSTPRRQSTSSLTWVGQGPLKSSSFAAWLVLQSVVSVLGQHRDPRMFMPGWFHDV